MLSIRCIISEFPLLHFSLLDSSFRTFDKNLLPETDNLLFLFRVSHRFWWTPDWKSICMIFSCLNYFAVLSMCLTGKIFFLFFEGQLWWRDRGVQASSWADVQVVQAVPDCGGVLHQAPKPAAEGSAAEPPAQAQPRCRQSPHLGQCTVCDAFNMHLSVAVL